MLQMAIETRFVRTAAEIYYAWCECNAAMHKKELTIVAKCII